MTWTCSENSTPTKHTANVFTAAINCVRSTNDNFVLLVLGRGVHEPRRKRIMAKVKTRPPELSVEQKHALRKLLSFKKRIQTLGGYAGTGKTTLIKAAHEELEKFAVCAFTGKAANVLRRKGVPATTIHSLIYKPEEKDSLFKDAKGKRRRELTWRLRSKDEMDLSGFIVDESSMVTRPIYDDLCSYGLPIIFVGDHGQLEPIGDSFNLMRSPDVRLEKVHRNAGEIAHFAEFIREGNDPCDWLDNSRCTGEAVRIIRFSELATLKSEPDQFICRFNKTRVTLNMLCRDILDFPDSQPVVGDRVMCLRNIHGKGLFNGMQGEIAAIDTNKT